MAGVRRGFVALAALLAAALLSAAASPSPRSLSGLVALAPELWLLPGSYELGRQPDGNSVLLRGSKGWILVDSGRHAQHSQRLLDAMAGDGAPLLAVVNSHWHLDHVGGNPRLRAAHPGLKVYASRAIEGAKRGFLANYRGQLAARLLEAGNDPAKQAPWRAELALIDAGRALYPDVAVTAEGIRTLAGRKLHLGFEANAVTGGDVWVFDPATRTLIAGDLVTLPAPFLDTACPTRWRAALERLAAVDFVRLVPGHGAPLSPAGFTRYRRAFGNLLDCAAGRAEHAACLDGWQRDLGPLLPASDRAASRELLGYYLEHKLGDGAQTAAACAGG